MEQGFGRCAAYTCSVWETVKNLSVMLSVAMRSAQQSSLRSRSIPTYSRLHPRVPLQRQVEPVRISSHDQRDFFSSRPAFELLLAGERFVYVVIRFPVQQPGHIIAV